jgi:hypothetical protein
MAAAAQARHRVDDGLFGSAQISVDHVAESRAGEDRCHTARHALNNRPAQIESGSQISGATTQAASGTAVVRHVRIRSAASFNHSADHDAVQLFCASRLKTTR